MNTATSTRLSTSTADSPHRPRTPWFCACQCWVALCAFAAGQASAITFAEGFDGGAIHWDVSSSSGINANNNCNSGSGMITLRDRDCGGSPFSPANWVLDFYNGQGASITFKLSTGTSETISRGAVGFDLGGYSGDGGTLFKFVSNDGVNFVPVGDSTANGGTYIFDLMPGNTDTFFRLQAGNSNGPFDGVWMDNLFAVLNPATPNAGQFIPPPRDVPGKEYSNEGDTSSTPAGVVLDDQQNTKWNGTGGVTDTFDYNGADGTVAVPEHQTDAIANVRDTLFHEARTNNAAILFSTRIDQNGGMDYGAPAKGCALGDPVCSEAVSGKIATWATWPQVDSNWQNAEKDPNGLLKNLDGLEVWAPMPPTATAPNELTNQRTGELAMNDLDDANRFSLFSDAGNCAVWAGVGPGSACYVFHDELAALAPFTSLPGDKLDIDALMVFDEVGATSQFDNGDWLMFSLWPIAGSSEDVGDSVWVWHKGFSIELLNHGGHLWGNNWLGVNIDALEAVAVPEPPGLMLVGIGLAGLAAGRRRNA